MSFRYANASDALPLYRLRLKAEEQPWYEGVGTSWDEHVNWLRERLGNKLVTVLVWDDFDGCVRIDSNGEITFDAVSEDVAVEMLAVLLRNYPSRLKATFDADDPRASILERVGFTPYPARALVYRP